MRGGGDFNAMGEKIKIGHKRQVSQSFLMLFPHKNPVFLQTLYKNLSGRKDFQTRAGSDFSRKYRLL